MLQTALAILWLIPSGDATFTPRDLAIASAYYVGVVRYVGPEGSFNSNWSNDPKQPNVLNRHRFASILNLVGSPNEIIVLADNAMGKNDSFKARVRPGHVYLAHMFKPDANLRVKVASKGDKFLMFENANQLYLTGDNNPVILYDIAYTSRGESVFEKYAYILAQSYAVNRLYQTLAAIIASAPTNANAETRPFVEPYKTFYKAKVQPILNAGSDDDVKLRLRVFSTHASVLGGESIAVYHNLVREIERTWQDPQYPMIFGLLYNDDAFNTSLLKSRMPAARSEAIPRLTHDGAGNKSLVVLMLSDTNVKVKRVAIQWLHTYATAKKMKPLPPEPRWKPNGIAENEAAIKQYWASR